MKAEASTPVVKVCLGERRFPATAAGLLLLLQSRGGAPRQAIPVGIAAQR
jgi:hypothetical protein